MGLDMYAYRAAKEDVLHIDGLEVNFATGQDGYAKTTEIAYWRKFNNLHGWMHRLYCERGGEGEFNCEMLQLRAEDIDRLEQDAQKRKNLDPTSGFFFGSGNPLDDDDVADIMEFVKNARQVLESGDYVFYYSWW